MPKRDNNCRNGNNYLKEVMVAKMKRKYLYVTWDKDNICDDDNEIITDVYTLKEEDIKQISLAEYIYFIVRGDSEKSVT